MQTSLIEIKPLFPVPTSRPTGYNGDGGQGNDARRGPGDDDGPLISSQLGVWIFLGVVTMLFACFASAYIVRRAGTDWRHIDLPAILWFNTGVLLVSSITIEAARAAHKRVGQGALCR